MNCGVCVITLIAGIKRKEEVHEDIRIQSLKNWAVPWEGSDDIVKN